MSLINFTKTELRHFGVSEDGAVGSRTDIQCGAGISVGRKTALYCVVVGAADGAEGGQEVTGDGGDGKGVVM